MKTLLTALVVAVVLATSAAGANPSSSVIVTPIPATPSYGVEFKFAVAGDDAGWVRTFCTQSGHGYQFPGIWYYPFYGYFAETTVKFPPFFINGVWVDPNDGTPIRCTSTYYDFIAYKGNGGCGSFYPPVMSSCTRTKVLGAVTYEVSP